MMVVIWIIALASSRDSVAPEGSALGARIEGSFPRFPITSLKVCSKSLSHWGQLQLSNGAAFSMVRGIQQCVAKLYRVSHSPRNHQQMQQQNRKRDAVSLLFPAGLSEIEKEETIPNLLWESRRMNQGTAPWQCYTHSTTEKPIT